MQPRVVDLFCGCGGFALGAHKVGLSPTMSFDIDANLTSSIAANFPRTNLKLADLSSVVGSDIETEVGSRVDGIFGGPPCQAFSSIGHRKPDDPRRTLLGHFYRLVKEVQPKFFVMENVEGLTYGNARSELDEAIAQVPGHYKIIEPTVFDAADFGAATKRRRVFVIGYDPGEMNELTLSDFEAAKKPPTTVADAIADLEGAIELGIDQGFDVWQLPHGIVPSSYARSLRSASMTFTGNQRTTHSKEVRARFASIPPGGRDKVGRHPKLSWDGQCPTIRAGTGSDRGSFQAVRPLHPVEPRVITVREAARLQGFPDDFRFHPTIWHSYRMIGNSVSPIMAETIFSLIANRLYRGNLIEDAAE